MDIHTARQLLDAYSCIELKTPATERDRADLRAAIVQLTAAAESEIFGICADTAAAAYTALAQYLAALGDDTLIEPEVTVPGNVPVYLKYNATTGNHYLNAYLGDDRGVLLACQAQVAAVNGTFGYLPLDLFAGSH